jgi:hypothetical protein
MKSSSEVLEETIKRKGYWHFMDLYEFCFSWLKNHEFLLKENLYSEKLDTGGKEIKIEWEAERTLSKYFKEEISLSWHILLLNDAEIEVDGKKIKTNKGELKIKISAELVSDYKDEWKNKAIQKIYEKFIIKDIGEDYEDDLEHTTKEFISDLKTFLEVQGI